MNHIKKKVEPSNNSIQNFSMGNISTDPRMVNESGITVNSNIQNQNAQADPLMAQFQNMMQQNPQLFMEYMKSMGFQKQGNDQHFPISQIPSQIQVY